MSPEFRAGERDVQVRIYCTECGRLAEGNNSWADGSGEICDACADVSEASEASEVEVPS